MKTSVKKATLVQFENASISTKKQVRIKGGNDIIIEEAVIG